MTSPSTRRLLKESTDLHKNPSPYFTASPTSDSNLHDWHFTLVGPPNPSPYAKGLYHGRITFPAAYPLRPPSFRFLTPSARFEVNREICLSISGHHEETWQPAWGVRTALLAIRSEIFSGESKGQVGGMEGSELLRREYAELSRGWVCHECGGSNEERMKEVWDNCREKGVEVDVEGEGGGEGGGDDSDTNKSDDQTREESEGGKEKAQDHDIQDSPAVPTIPKPELQYQSRPEAEISSISQSDRSDSSQPSQFAPRSTTNTTSTPPSSSIPSTSTLPNSPAVQTNPRPPLTTTSPSNSPWLDRAIICVAVALVIMILRRTIDPEDL